MSATTQHLNVLQTYPNTAAAHEAQAALIKRLIVAAEIVQNLRKKRFHNMTLPPELLWVGYGYHRMSESTLVSTGDEQFPVQITYKNSPYYKGGTYDVPAVFLFGSTWQISSFTRRCFYRAAYRKHLNKRQTLVDASTAAQFGIDHVDEALNKEIEKVEQEAKRKIAELRANFPAKHIATQTQARTDAEFKLTHVNAVLARIEDRYGDRVK